MKTDYADKKLPEKQDTMVLDDTELGDIKIHEGVIASLARKAALSAVSTLTTCKISPSSCSIS